MTTISLDKALNQAVLQHPYPLITRVELYDILLQMYETKIYKGRKIKQITKDLPSREIFRKRVAALSGSGVLAPYKRTSAYVITGKEDPTAEQSGCYLYPYAYLCYLNAMEYHNLTDRIPKSVHLMMPPAALSKELFLSRHKPENIFLSRSNARITSKIDSKDFFYHQTINFPIYPEVTNLGGVRVSSIARTFLDMFKKPVHCGGFEHVLTVFEDYGKTYRKKIISEFDQQGSNLDKSRIGFLFENHLGITDSTIEEWSKNTSRGGSRVLVPGQAFSPYFSERWDISINHERFTHYGTRN
jgi:predicted transcriptional regulator of viral defense system